MLTTDQVKKELAESFPTQFNEFFKPGSDKLTFTGELAEEVLRLRKVHAKCVALDFENQRLMKIEKGLREKLNGH